jgi:hypothetical protein
LLPLLSVGVGGGVLVCCVVVLLSSAEIVLLFIVSLCLLLLQPRFEFRKKSFHLFFSRAAREKKRFYVVVVEEARDDDFPRALRTRTTPPRCEKKPNEKQRRFSRNTESNESAFVVWREDRETFPENDAFRMKDTHTTPNRFRIKSQRRGKMFDEFFPQTKKL